MKEKYAEQSEANFFRKKIKCQRCEKDTGEYGLHLPPPPSNNSHKIVMSQMDFSIPAQCRCTQVADNDLFRIMSFLKWNSTQ